MPRDPDEPYGQEPFGPHFPMPDDPTLQVAWPIRDPGDKPFFRNDHFVRELTEAMMKPLLCDVAYGGCRCGLAPHPADEPHVCAECDGSWRMLEGACVMVRPPQRMPDGSPTPFAGMSNEEAEAWVHEHELRRLQMVGMDPLLAAAILARGPYVAERGGIRFIKPPTLAGS